MSPRTELAHLGDGYVLVTTTGYDPQEHGTSWADWDYRRREGGPGVYSAVPATAGGRELRGALPIRVRIDHEATGSGTTGGGDTVVRQVGRARVMTPVCMFRATVEVRDAVRRIAHRERITVAQVVRRAVEEYVERAEGRVVETVASPMFGSTEERVIRRRKTTREVGR